MMVVSKVKVKPSSKPGIRKTKSTASTGKVKENRKELLKALKSGNFSDDILAKAKKILQSKDAGDSSISSKEKKKSEVAKPEKRKRKLEEVEENGEVNKKAKKLKNEKIAKTGAKVKGKGKLKGILKPSKAEKTDTVEGEILSKRRLKVKEILSKKTRPEGLSKKERRALRVSRRKDGDLVQRLLAMWEELRVTACPADRRSELCRAMIGQAAGKIASLVLAHDTCRVFETVVKVGTEEQRLRVLEEVEGEETMRGVMRSKFGKFLLHKMLQYGSARHKERVFAAISGNVVRMLHHRQAVYVLNAAFNDFATAAQRSSILQETYGPPFAVLKEPGVSRLKEAFAARPNTNKETVLAFVKEVLSKAIAKGNVNYMLVHTLLWDFLETCGEADRAEMVGMLKEHVVALLHTREGVKTAMMVLWISNNKDRKAILRSLKTFFGNSAVDEHGYFFILACLDAVDDIVLLSKLVIKELLENLETLLTNQYGRKVVLYMLSRRNLVHFHPQMLEILKRGDSNPHTKKAPEIRDKELRERILSPLLAFVCGKISTLCSPNNALLVLRELLVVSSMEKAAQFGDLVSEIVKLLLSEETVCADGKESLTENSGGHIALKKAMQATAKEEMSVGKELLNQLQGKSLQKLLLTNRGCFLLVAIIESTEKDTVQKLSEMLKPDLDILTKQKTQGAGILRKKLKC